MKRYLVALSALAVLLSSTGCVMPGPIHDRLYVKEWISKKRSPIPLDKSWKYEGETYERCAYVTDMNGGADEER